MVLRNVGLGPTSKPKLMAFGQSIGSGGVVAMQIINDVINFAGWMFEGLPPQNYAMAHFFVWCGLGLVGVGLVGVVVFRKRTDDRLQKLLDEVSRHVRILEAEESRRIIELLYLSLRSESRMHQENVSSLPSPEGQRIHPPSVTENAPGPS